MKQLRATISVALCWALAASTLLAGSPHVDCRCPDGRIKPFCLSIFFQTACCVEDSCCPAQDQHALGKSCCCQSCHPNRSEPSADSGQVRSEGCSKKIVGAQVYPLPDLPRDAGYDLTPHGLAIMPATLLSLAPVHSETRGLSLAVHRPSLSNNLIIVLQHFLI